MGENEQAMDDESKFRITGAVIWLLLLVVIVPIWYSNPVNFQPESERATESSIDNAVVYQAYVLPSKSEPVSETEAMVLPPVKSAQNTSKTVEKPSEKATSNKAEPIAENVQEGKIKRGSAVDSSPKLKSGVWLVKVYASKDIKDANKVLGQLDDKYEVWIKEYPKTKTFSVRTGPYASKVQAEKDKLKIDKAIRTQSQIVQVK